MRTRISRNIHEPPMTLQAICRHLGLGVAHPRPRAGEPLQGLEPSAGTRLRTYVSAVSTKAKRWEEPKCPSPGDGAKAPSRPHNVYHRWLLWVWTLLPIAGT